MPHSLEVLLKMLLPEPIVLGTQASPSFPPLSMYVDDTTSVTIELQIDENKLRRKYLSGIDHDPQADKEFWVVSRADALLVTVTLSDVSEDDVLRIESKHHTARHERMHDVVHQDAPEFAERVGKAAVLAVGKLLRELRRSFGQYWLRHLGQPEHWPNFLRAHTANWRYPHGNWKPLVVGPLTCGTIGLTLGIADQYLSSENWKSVEAYSDAARLGCASRLRQ